MLGLTKPRQPTAPTVCGINVGTLESVRTVGGWELGVIVSPDRRQATVQFDLPDTDVLDENAWSLWEQAVASVPQIVATFTVDTVGDNTPAVRAGAVFRAVGNTETKDHDQFLADIARGVAPLFDAADRVLPTESRPLSPADLTSHLSTSMGITETSDWSALGDVSVTETDRVVTVGGVEWSVFQTPADAHTLFAELDELTGDWEGIDWLRRTRIFRPQIVADAEDDTTLAGSGRRHQLITTLGGSQATTSLIDFLSAPAAIALRRSWQRQRALGVAGLGTGLLGFQNPLTTLRRPTPVPAARY